MPNNGLFIKTMSPLLFWWLLPAIASSREYKDFRVQHFGDEVLPQVTVWNVLGDREGFLWIGTQLGLARFDGQHIKVYTPDNTPGIKMLRSVDLYQDRAGNANYRDAEENFYQLTPSGPQLSSRKKWDITHERVYQIGRELFFYDNSHPPGDPSFKYSGVRHDGVITYTYAFGKDSVQRVIQDTKPRHDPAFFSGKNLYLFDNLFRPIRMYPGTPVTYMTLTGDLQSDPLFLDQNAYVHNSKFYEQNDGIYYRLGNNIYRFEPIGDTMHVTKIISNMELKNVTDFYADNRNQYYAIGTAADGLYILRANDFSVRQLQGNESINVFYGVLPVKDNLFFSSNGHLFDLHGKYDQVIVKNANNFSLFRHKEYIYGSRDEIMYRMDNEMHLDPKFNVRLSGWLSDGAVDDKGRFWIGALTGFGSQERDSIDWIFREIRLAENRARTVESFLFKDDHTIWVALRDGIIEVDTRTRKWKDVPQMAGKYVRKLMSDEYGGIWILTYGDGYYYYKNGRFTMIPLDRHKYLTAVHAMHADKTGHYWMPTNKGLFRVHKKALYNYLAGQATEIKYEYFDKRCGFLTNEFNGGCNPCGLVMSDTLIIMPSMNGLVYFNPLSVSAAPLDNDIYIENIVLDGKRLPLDTIFLAPSDFRSFRFDISSPFYGVSENMVLEYRINGVTEGWQPLIDNRYIQFNRLPHGDYKVRIRKLINFSTGEYKEVQVSFKVAVPWYLKTSFVILCAIVVIGFITFFVRLRLRMLTAQKMRLEEQVQERTNDLADSLVKLKSTVQTLEQSQADLYRSNRFREQLTSIVLHDIQTPLRFLKRVAKNVMQSHPDMPPANLNKELEDLYYSTAEVAAYSEDFLIWIKSQNEAFEIVYKDVNVCALIEEIANLYYKIAANEGAMIHIHCPEDLTLHTDAALLSIVIRNLTDNAIKYSKKGTIHIRAVRFEKGLSISVSDNGVGMTQEQVHKIMADDANAAITSSGKLGYQFIKDLLRILNGSLKITSSPGKGTTVTMNFTTQ